MFFAFDLGRFFTLSHLKAQQQAFAGYYAPHTALTILIYFAVYVAVTALSLPGAAARPRMFYRTYRVRNEPPD